MKLAKVFWFTGLSGAGKSTISIISKNKLELEGYKVLILDGDVVRSEINPNLGFSKIDIEKNNHIILELCINSLSKYDIIFVPIISPYKKSRKNARKKLNFSFYEIYIYAELKTLYQRDTKGLYKLARKGLINNLIGISNSNKYEPPSNPDLKLNTTIYTEEETVNYFTNFVKNVI